MTVVVQYTKKGYSSEYLFDFTHDFKVAKISDTKYLNLLRDTSFIKEFSELCRSLLTSYFLREGNNKKMLNPRF